MYTLKTGQISQCSPSRFGIQDPVYISTDLIQVTLYSRLFYLYEMELPCPLSLSNELYTGSWLCYCVKVENIVATAKVQSIVYYTVKTNIQQVFYWLATLHICVMIG